MLAAALGLVSGPAVGAALAAQEGVTAPAPVVGELQAVLAKATQRFEARDVAGVLASVSDQYRTGPFTKPGIREQLIAIYMVQVSDGDRIMLRNQFRTMLQSAIIN